MAQLTGRAEAGVNELALPIGNYLLMQETASGKFYLYVGPQGVTQQGQFTPAVYDPDKNNFNCDVSLEEAIRPCIFADENQYIILHNPAIISEAKKDKEPKHPQPNNRYTDMPVLAYGETEIIPGPICIALWPQQSAKVIDGHQLRPDQYLYLHVTNGEKAKKNWDKVVVKKADDAEPATPEELAAKVATRPIKAVAAKTVYDFSPGSLIKVTGKEAKFVMPCTGVVVEPDSEGQYVRQAPTLEQTDYAIIIKADGTKAYPRGPQVLYPEPDEELWSDNDGNQKFQAVDLTERAGIHVRVIAPYEETVAIPYDEEMVVDGVKKQVKHAKGDKVQRNAGDELFITGQMCPLYFPQPEHAVIRYGNDQMVHYGVVVEIGEGRYVMDRIKGTIETREGPDNILLDPRKNVFVRRVLPPQKVNSWFPKSPFASQYNDALRAKTELGKSFVPESVMNAAPAASMADMGLEYTSRASTSSASMKRAAPAVAQLADVVRRKESFTPPRQVILDTYGQGAVPIQPYVGHAVQVVGKDGKTRVVVGPERILLAHHEDLQEMEFSTGKPKNTDNLLKSPYLQIQNVQVGDIIQDLVSQDGIPCEVKVSMRVNFKLADKEKWFNVPNPVKLLCDRVRSKLKAVVRGMPIETFYLNFITIIRDTLLGPHVDGQDRAGTYFPENGMHLVEVDVTSKLDIKNAEIATQLQRAQNEVMQQNLELARLERKLQATQKQEEFAQKTDEAQAATLLKRNELQIAAVTEAMLLAAKTGEKDLSAEQQRKQIEEVKQSVQDLIANAALARTKAEQSQAVADDAAHMEIDLKRLKAEADATVAKFNAAKEGLVQALVALGDKVAAATVAEALNPMNLIHQIGSGGNGRPFSDLLKQFIPGLEEAVGHITSSKPGGRLPDGAKVH